MNIEGIIRVILALTVPLFLVLVFTLRFTDHIVVPGDDIVPFIEMWENVIVFIVGALTGGVAVHNVEKRKDDDDAG